MSSCNFCMRSQFDQFTRLGGRERHRLFEQNVQAAFQRGFGLLEMNIRRRGDNDGVEFLKGENFIEAGAGVFRAESRARFFRPWPVARLCTATSSACGCELMAGMWANVAHQPAPIIPMRTVFMVSP